MLKWKQTRHAAIAVALAASLALAVTTPPRGAEAADKEEQVRISFDSVEGLTCKPGYKCVEANAIVVTDDVREGAGAVKTTWKSAPDNYGLVNMSVDIPETDLSGRSFTIKIKPLGREGHIWGIEFYDIDGNKVEEHRMFHLGADRWNTWNFSQGEKSKYGWIGRGKGDLTRIVRIGFRAQTRAGAQTAAALWDDFRIVSPVVTEKIERAANLSDTPPTVSTGGTAVWLDGSNGYALQGMRLAGQWLEPSVGNLYPTFTFVDDSGNPKVIKCSDSGWKVKAPAQGPGKYGVTYTCDDTTTKVLWRAEADAVQCEITVVSEGALKAAEVGAERIFGMELTEEDYGISPHEFLVKYTKEPVRMRGLSEARTPLFVAAKSKDAILYYKPLAASQEMEMTVREADGDRLAWMGGTLYFRPPEFKNPETRLCHKSLAWRAETAGDVNRDGEVDWVDCGIAYRERYIKPNRNKSKMLRDSFRYYHPLYIKPSYEHLLETVKKIDFATGVWWMKGMMVTNMSPASEAHPGTVERYAPTGDLAKVKKEILSHGALIGPYYGHDYIDIANGDWPEELIKRDKEGRPHRYYTFHDRQLYYKDNVRGIATEALKKHYERILDACWLEPGDTIMLDTFTAYARPGYHPDYPATVQTEVEAKHELARWLKYDKGLVVAGEGIVEGTQDVVDYGAIVVQMSRDFVPNSLWNRDWVPLKAVVFHGSTYFGASWYSARRPDINYAAYLVNCVGLWQWSTLSQNHPDHLYNMTARDFFFEHVFWSRIADQKIVDVKKNAPEYTFTFAGGSVLWVDPENRKYWLEEDGIRYDGFTPFNNKGVMAIIQQGDFDVVLPVKDMLEVIPSQPNREKLDVTITKEPDGRIRVKGNFSKVPFKVVHYPRGDDWRWIDADPVLMLRRVR